MAKRIISEADGRAALRMVGGTKNGSVALAYIFQLLHYGESLATSDPRKQERNVALHDVAVELNHLLN